MGMFASALGRLFKPRPDQAGETADASVGAIIRLLKGKRDEGPGDPGPREATEMPEPTVVMIGKAKPPGD